MDDDYGGASELSDRCRLKIGDLRLVSRKRKRALRKKGIVTWWSKDLSSYVRAGVTEQERAGGMESSSDGLRDLYSQLEVRVMRELREKVEVSEESFEGYPSMRLVFYGVGYQRLVLYNKDRLRLVGFDGLTYDLSVIDLSAQIDIAGGAKWAPLHQWSLSAGALGLNADRDAYITKNVYVDGILATDVVEKTVDGVTAVAYLWTLNKSGNPAAMVFIGDEAEPSFSSSFANETERSLFLGTTFEELPA